MQILANQAIINWHKVLPVTPVPIYLIYGGEPQQTLDAQVAINAHLSQHGFAERHKFVAENAKFNWDNLAALNSNLSLFSNKQIIDLELRTNGPGTQGSKYILDFFANSKPDLCLVISTDKLEAAATKTKWFLEISKLGCVVATKPIPIKNFYQYVIAKFSAAGFTLSNEAAHYLGAVDIWGSTGNSMALTQLIARLQLCFHQPRRLELADITPYVDLDANFSVFELVDTATSGDLQGTYKALESLKNGRIDPIIVIWAFVREVRSLITVHYMTKTGMPLADACRYNGVWSTKIPAIQALLAKVPIAFLEELLQNSSTVDTITKSIANGLIWESLFTLYLKLAGAKLSINLEETT